MEEHSVDPKDRFVDKNEPALAGARCALGVPFGER
jgi:hypothetical protein